MLTTQICLLPSVNYGHLLILQGTVLALLYLPIYSYVHIKSLRQQSATVRSMMQWYTLILCLQVLFVAVVQLLPDDIDKSFDSLLYTVQYSVSVMCTQAVGIQFYWWLFKMKLVQILINPHVTPQTAMARRERWRSIALMTVAAYGTIIVAF